MLVVQYFWFRHCFLLSDGQMEAILQLAVTMLSDRKLEVAQLAALSLSGLLKALPAASIEALRQRYLDAAKGMKPAKRVKLSGPGLGTLSPLSIGLQAPRPGEHRVTCLQIWASQQSWLSRLKRLHRTCWPISSGHLNGGQDKLLPSCLITSLCPPSPLC